MHACIAEMSMVLISGAESADSPGGGGDSTDNCR